MTQLNQATDEQVNGVDGSMVLVELMTRHTESPHCGLYAALGEVALGEDELSIGEAQPILAVDGGPTERLTESSEFIEVSEAQELAGQDGTLGHRGESISTLDSEVDALPEERKSLFCSSELEQEVAQERTGQCSVGVLAQRGGDEMGFPEQR